MGKLPVLPLDPDSIEGELTTDQLVLLAQSFIILVNYVEAQRARCAVRD
jgi:hypothetical protein